MRSIAGAIFLLLLLPGVLFAQGVPIDFTLDRGGYLTIVIEKEDRDGDLIRVRNLIQDQYFDAGSHTIFWDGYGMGEPVRNHHARYDIIERPAEIGEYRVRALIHKGVDLKYQFSVYQPGQTPWQTADPSSGWLGEHGPAVGVAFLPNGVKAARQPLLAITSVSGEVYRNTAYVDMDGKKLHGNHPGHYIMHYVTVDRGPNPERRYDGYTLTDIIEANQPMARVHGLISDPNNSNDTERIAGAPIHELGGHHLGGLAAWNGFVLVSLPSMNKVGVLNATTRSFVGFIEDVPMPFGIEFSPQGHLYVAHGINRAGTDVPPRISRYDWSTSNPLQISNERVVVSSGLQAPRQLRFHLDELYVSDAGFRPNTGFGEHVEAHHQVKVFHPSSGALLRTIGTPGGPQWGRYDETRMHNPKGFDIDARGQLWVAEYDYAPRRVSVWNAKSGQFIRAYYGNSKYAGGGTFDPTDHSRMFYSTPTNADESLRTTNETIEFHVDWENPENSKPKRILWRQAKWDPWAYTDGTFFLGYAPEHAHIVDGNLYLTNWHQNGGGREPEMIGIWKYDEAKERLRLVSVVGAIGHEQNSSWPVLNEPHIRSMWDAYHGAKALVSWADLNGDGLVQPNELQFRRIHPEGGYHAPYHVGSGSIATDLTYTSAMGLMIRPKFTSAGIPVYHLDELKRAALVPREHRYGGDGAQSVAFFPENEMAMHFGGPLSGWKLDFDRQVNGDRIHEESYGKMVWQYHVQTPSSSSAVGADYFPRYSGDIHRMMRYINAPMKVDDGEAGEIVAISAYHGSVHIMTQDGFYLTDLGADSRLHGNWMDVMGAPPWRGKSTQNRGLRGESYFHSLSKLNDGRIVFQGGGDTNIFLVEGLETARRLDFGTIRFTAEDLARLEGQREINTGVMENRSMRIYLNSDITVDGNLNEWPDSLFVDIDRSRSITAALASDGDYLFAAWRTQDPRMLNNPQSTPLPEVFRAGGGLDIFVANSTDIFKGNPTAVPYPLVPRKHRKGDQRIFVTKDGDPDSDQFRVYLFEKVNPRAAPGEGYMYYSPIFPQGISFARAVEISDQVMVRQQGGHFEVGIPLQVLDNVVWPGKKVLGDIGVVIGNGDNAISRSYWNNHSRIMTNDLPTEAEWWTAHMGEFHFVGGNPHGGTGPAVALGGFQQREVNGSAPISLSATIQNPGAGIDRVEFKANFVKIGEAVHPPYQLSWQPEVGGEYVITARAFDRNGASSFSRPDTVTIWSGLPAGWSNRDITRSDSFGYDGLSGDAVGGGTTFQVTGTGKYIVANGGSNHHFVYHRVSGDFDIQTSVLGPHNSKSHNAHGGLTVRRDLEFDSPHSMVLASWLGVVTGWTRARLDQNARITETKRQHQFPIYFRITRTGNEVSTFSSTNGSNWELVRTEELDLGEDAYVGLVMSNGNGAAGQSQTFRFDRMRLNGELIGDGAFENGAEPDQSRVVLTSPRPNDILKLPGSITLSADVLHPSGTVSRVVFNSGSETIGEALHEPYQIEWQQPPEGEHFLTARAYVDGKSNPVTSSVVKFYVQHNRNVTLPRPWHKTQIGNTQDNGGAEGNGDQMVVWGSGSGLNGASEAATFIYQPNTVEVEIAAQLLDLSELGPSDFVGLMAREVSQPGAPFAAITADASGKLLFSYRTAQNQFATEKEVALNAGSKPWLKLERNGSRFTASFSEDGQSWQEAGTTELPIPPPAKIGITIGSADPDQVARASLGGVEVFHTQRIGLKPGWNLVSSWVAPAVTELRSLTGPLGSSLVVMKQGNGQVYVPEHDIDEIGNWAWNQGYSIFMTSTGSMGLKGRKLLPESDHIAIAKGWNTIPFLLSEEVSVSYAFRHISEHTVLVKDIAGNVYIPSYGINTIGMLTPGQAYQLFSTEDAQLAYPSHSEISTGMGETGGDVPAAAATGAPRHYESAVVPSAYSATLVLKVELPDGDEIAVRASNGTIVGTGVVVNGRAVAAVFGRGSEMWAQDGGAVEGDQLTVHAWSSERNSEVKLELESVVNLTGQEADGHSLTYRSNAIWVAEGTEKPSEFHLGQNYPNPFNPSTRIEYSLPAETPVTITVFNMLGQAVGTIVDEVQRAGGHAVQFNGSGLASGVYIYQIRAGEFVESRRMTLLK